MRCSPALLCATVVVLSTAPAGTVEADGEVPRTEMRSTGRWLGERGPFDPRPLPRPLLGDGLLGPDYFERKNRYWIDKGITFGGYLSANVQWGSQGGQSHSISESLLLASWEPMRRNNGAGRLVFGLAHDETFGRPTTRAFANEQGLVETPNDLDTDPDLTFTTLGLLHWEQEQWTGPDSGWAYRAGQIYAPSYFGAARYLDDDRRYFMARPLATAAGAQWVGFNDVGLGVNGIAWNGPWYLSLAAIDGKANRQYPDFKSLQDLQLLYIGEVGFESDIDGPNEAAVRLTVSHLDVTDGDNPSKGRGQSIMISAEKRFNGRWAVAGRWSESFERLSADYRDLYSIAAMWLTPLERDADIAGLGLFSGRPSDGTRGRESGGEIFYRVKLTQAVGLMVDFQYWSRDDDGGESTDSRVWGLRTEFEF
ncbi:MAG: hypothetical protein KJP17_10710 [Gammaproteobacteria bacterium]|nr:hypothetical protein [Gammaproteobacteria bacterium]